jgi:hypothetical protein
MDSDAPISKENLRDLFECLDRKSMTGYECDHSYIVTSCFLAERDLPVGATVPWLGGQGAGCDCEVIFNVVPVWEEAVGYVPPDE